MTVRIIETIPLFSGRAGITGVWRLVRFAFAAVLLSVVLSGYVTAEDTALPATEAGWKIITPAELEELIVRGNLDVTEAIEAKTTSFVPLVKAVVWSDNPDVLDVLVKHGADVNWSDTRNGYTALHYAIKVGKVENMRRLLELGADVHLRDKIDDLPILFLVMQRDSFPFKDSDIRKKQLDILLSYGADLYAEVNLSDGYAHNLLMDVAIDLSSHPNERESYTGLLDYLVALGIHPDSVPTRNNGVNAVHAATFLSGGEYAVKELVRLGADVNLRTTAGATPLIFFAGVGVSMDVWDELLAQGADIDATNVAGRSVLYHARIRMKGEYDFIYEGENSPFSSVEEWRVFGGEIVARIETLCEEGKYRVCDELDEDVDSKIISPELEKALIQGLKLWLLL